MLAIGLAGDACGWYRIGGVVARGNTDMETVNANLDVANEVGGWTYKMGASFLNTVEDDIASPTASSCAVRANYALTERSYLFGACVTRTIASQTSPTRLFSQPAMDTSSSRPTTTKFEGQIGLGYRKVEILVTGETVDEPIARGAIDFEHKLTNTTLIYERFLVEHGEENTYIQNALGIEVKISDAFALALDYQVRQNSEVLPGTEKTDQVLTANLVYGF